MDRVSCGGTSLLEGSESRPRPVRPCSRRAAPITQPRASERKAREQQMCPPHQLQPPQHAPRSRAVGGSILNTRTPLKSRRSARSCAVTAHGVGGRQASTWAGVKGQRQWVGSGARRKPGRRHARCVGSRAAAPFQTAPEQQATQPASQDAPPHRRTQKTPGPTPTRLWSELVVVLHALCLQQRSSLCGQAPSLPQALAHLSSVCAYFL